MADDAAVIVLERRAAGPVPDDVGPSCRIGRRRRAPELARLFVAQVDRLADRVAYRVVVPGREPEEEAVLRPGRTRPRAR